MQPILFLTPASATGSWRAWQCPTGFTFPCKGHPYRHMSCCCWPAWNLEQRRLCKTSAVWERSCYFSSCTERNGFSMCQTCLFFFFPLTTCSLLFIKWHPDSSVSHLLWLKYFTLSNTMRMMANKNSLKARLLWKQSLLFPTYVRC